MGRLLPQADAALDDPTTGLKIDLRDADENWDFLLENADTDGFDITVTGAAAPSAYAGLSVKLEYSISGAEIWTGLDVALFEPRCLTSFRRYGAQEYDLWG